MSNYGIKFMFTRADYFREPIGRLANDSLT